MDKYKIEVLSNLYNYNIGMHVHMYKHAAASDQAVRICILNPQLQTRLNIIYIGALHQLHSYMHGIACLSTSTYSVILCGGKKERTFFQPHVC